MRPFLVLLATLAACGTPPAPTATPGVLPSQGEVVATYGDGDSLTRDVVGYALNRVPPQQLDQMIEMGQLDRLAANIAVGEQLYQKALSDGLHEQPEVKVRLAMAAREALAQAHIERIADAAVTDEALQAAYEARKVQYAKPGAKIRAILLEDGDLAAEIGTKLAGGADFAALANEHSKDRSSAENGGDLGWVVKGQLAGAVDERVFGTDATGVLEPAEANGRWFVVDVMERRDLTPLDDVREQLEGEVKQQAVQTSYVGEIESGITLEWSVEPAALVPQKG